MGLGLGGRMQQEIYKDPYDLADWDTTHSAGCCAHLCNSLVWRAITGESPPTTPPTAAEYNQAGLPWFEYYSDKPAVAGSEELARLKSVLELGQASGRNPLPENTSVEPAWLVGLGQKRDRYRVREGGF